ncbi:hypothetical protein NP233_g9254 [Leucocoprinus birnbaumii]|uniref:Uncharacterized protein n=1 Tax=Leucocoprinus birnbaumii TaxID=56174 RepID=A0AAD5YT27_9AGAR|nr:hypothetical protein NP233_g9254 [Leucocoprinus birnbaumii]
MEDWTPERTIRAYGDYSYSPNRIDSTLSVTAFGQDEEVSGPRGASNIAKFLENKYGQYGVAMIVDERVIPIEMEGGQQVIILQYTLAAALMTTLTPLYLCAKSGFRDIPIMYQRESPIWGYLSCVISPCSMTQISKEVSSSSPDFKSAAENFSAELTRNRYLIQTSKASTIIKGGLKINALAETVTAMFNSPVDPFSSLLELFNLYVESAKPIAKKYSLLIQGKSYPTAPKIGNMGLSGTTSGTPVLSIQIWEYGMRYLLESCPVSSRPGCDNGTYGDVGERW